MIVPSRVVWGASLLSGIFGWMVGLGAGWYFLLVLPFVIIGCIYTNRVS